MAHVAQMLTQEPIYKPSSIFCFKPILLSAHKLAEENWRGCEYAEERRLYLIYFLPTILSFSCMQIEEMQQIWKMC